MTTVLAVYNSDGCVGRCDVRCHGAKTPKCTCICGGKNHGAGSQAAEQNVRELVGLTDEDLQRFAEAHGLKAADLKTIDRVAIPGNRIARKAARRALLEPEFPWGSR